MSLQLTLDSVDMNAENVSDTDKYTLWVSCNIMENLDSISSPAEYSVKPVSDVRLTSSADASRYKHLSRVLAPVCCSTRMTIDLITRRFHIHWTVPGLSTAYIESW